jgi:acetyltransferase-like isoleucine patch superfamily enzyme
VGPQLEAVDWHGQGWMVRRFFLPAPLVSVIAWLKWRARVSPRAEVEVSSNLTLGPGTTVSSFAKIKSSQGALVTGRECGFASGCFVAPGPGGISMGDEVICGPNVVIIAMNYRYQSLRVPFARQGVTSLGVRIGSNVWIGANSTILDGAEIGDNSIVVANSLVNRRFPANVIIQGNPAKVVLQRPATPGGADGGRTGAGAGA